MDPVVFSQQTAFQLRLPERLHGTAQSLRQFIAVYDQLKDKDLDPKVRTDRLAELVTLHAALLQAGPDLLEPHSFDPSLQQKVPLILGQALRMLFFLEESIGLSKNFVDTHGSECLKLYKSDLKQGIQIRQRLIAVLKQEMGLSPEQLQSIKKSSEVLLQDARRKQAIVQSVCKIYGIVPENPRLKFAAFELFQHVYGPVPVATDDLDIIVSGTLVFFCLPFDEKTGSYHASVGPGASEAVQIKDFVAKLLSFKQQQFAHFPVFGFIKGEAMHRDLIAALVDDLPYDEATILRELDSLFTILPSQAVDKYLFHDVVGHSWQASMLSFEHSYIKMARYNLAFDQDSQFADFVLANHNQSEFRQTLKAWFLNQFESRLAVAMTPVLAEILADIGEFKFIDSYPQLVDKMPSSSHFKMFPTKLDFMVEDIRFYFRQAGKGFGFWLERDAMQLQTRQNLSAKGLKEPEIEVILAEIRSILQGLKASIWEHEYLCERDRDGELKINVVFKLALNFLSLHAAINSFYRELKALPPGEHALTHGFIDILLLGIGLYFEAEPKTALWAIDEFVHMPFKKLVGLLSRSPG